MSNNIFGVIIGMLLLLFPTFFFERFTLHYITTYSYPIFVLFGLATFILYTSKVFKINFKYGFALLIIFELIFFSILTSLKHRTEYPSSIQNTIQYLYNNRLANTPQYNSNLAVWG